MSTYEQTHQVIIGGDFNEEMTNINTTTRQQYVVSGVTIVSISFLQRIAVPPYPLGMRNGVIGSYIKFIINKKNSRNA
jgi:hypothetical protein